MERDQALAILEQHREPLRSLGVSSLSLFGSVARNQAGVDSDVDILVDLEPPLTFDRYMDVKLYLEDLLGTAVDLVSWRSLKPQIRDAVAREAIHVIWDIVQTKIQPLQEQIQRLLESELSDRA